MRRKLFTLCSALSLLLFVAVCVLWVRSYRAPTEWVDEIGGGSFIPGAAGGRIEVGWLGPERPLAPVPRFRTHRSVRTLALRFSFTDVRPRRTKWEWMGFAEQEGRLIVLREVREPRVYEWDTERPYRVWFLPAWPLALVLSVSPALWVGSRLRRRLAARASASRRRRALCTTCGYDLRATPERCPECGTCALHELPRLPSRSC